MLIYFIKLQILNFRLIKGKQKDSDRQFQKGLLSAFLTTTLLHADAHVRYGLF